jgi:DNA polymerase III alpha subunit
MVVGYAVGAAFWIAPAGATDAQAVKPDDEAMTCEQIATELAAYVQQIAPSIQALGATEQQMYAQGRQQLQQRKMEHEALTPLATAGALDNTGAAKQAYQLALMAQMAKEKAENEAAANSPLAKQNKAQSEQLAMQGRQMQSNARLQRLMQLGQAKHCDKR